jgi:hypothetical protein
MSEALMELPPKEVNRRLFDARLRALLDELKPDAADALDICDMMRPILEYGRSRAGWEIHVGIEWRDGQCFNFSGRNPPKVT